MKIQIVNPEENNLPEVSQPLKSLTPLQVSPSTEQVIKNLSQMAKQAEGVTYYAVPGYN